MIKIKNRRYIGNKNKLTENIYQALLANVNTKEKLTTFLDLFAGTGVVSEFFSDKGFKVILNDILYSNYVAYEAFFSNKEFNSEKVSDYLKFYNELKYEDLKENYFSDIYGGKYFSVNDAKKAGYIREHIENLKDDLSIREYYMLMTSLLYSVDKIANTVGHFEHYLKKEPIDKNLKLEILDNLIPREAQTYNIDANELSKLVTADVAYIDPPYNARQYINFYHVLENLARWEKPTEFEGISMKFKRNHLKSGYSQSKAKLLMSDLIKNLNVKYIIVSYNNTYSAKSVASNNKITENEILEILMEKGSTKTYDIPYKSFNSGKTNFDNHIEKIFVCKVGG
jgi:adenine-specific DNA-methyltransferase